MKKSATSLVGASGEHYVAAYLSGFQLIVPMPRAGIPGSDLFVSKEKGGHPLRVQVKTGTQATRRTKDVGHADSMPAERNLMTTTAPQTRGTLEDYLREAEARKVLPAGFRVLGQERLSGGRTGAQVFCAEVHDGLRRHEARPRRALGGNGFGVQGIERPGDIGGACRLRHGIGD
jgi:hypothetical protein